MDEYGLPENRPPTYPGEKLKEEFLDSMGMTQQAQADYDLYQALHGDVSDKLDDIQPAV